MIRSTYHVLWLIACQELVLVALIERIAKWWHHCITQDVAPAWRQQWAAQFICSELGQTWNGILYFSLKLPCGLPHISVRCSSVVRVDNWQIPRRTISRFHGICVRIWDYRTRYISNLNCLDYWSVRSMYRLYNGIGRFSDLHTWGRRGVNR